MEMSEVATAEGKEYSGKVREVLDSLSTFTLLELAELVDAFQEEFGIEAAVAAPVAAAAPGGGAAAEAEEEVEPTSFNVVLKSFGDKKIQVIKAVRAETSLALKEAKAVVEGVPSNIKEDVSKEDAEKCAEALREAGAEADVVPA
jgi:large subunit ribosomal protein L7/L12